VALIIAGLEIPHLHVHVVPMRTEADLHFDRADHHPDPAALDDAADRLRRALRPA
jgi:histidine triad (HIT) family protein